MDRIPHTPGIYVIRNLINGNIYVGSAASLYKRYHQHFTGLRRNKHKNPHLQAAFNKYGRDAFVFAVIELAENKEDLIAREQHFIDTLNPEYNIHRIAGSSLGYKAGEKTRAKLRQITKAQWESGLHPRVKGPMSEEQKRKVSASKKGVKFSLEVIEKRKLRKVSSETRRKMSDAHRKRYEDPGARQQISRIMKARYALETPEERTERLKSFLSGGRNNKGGYKNKGKIHTEETRKKMSEAAKNRVIQEENEKSRRAKVSEFHKKNWETRDRTVSEETRAKISNTLKGQPSANLGKKRTPEQIEQMKNRPISEETRRKMSESAKARKRTPIASETRQKIRESNKGQKKSEEARRKMSEAKKGKSLAPEHAEKIKEAKRLRHEARIKAREQERIAKEQALLARWENAESPEPIDPTEYKPLSLFDIDGFAS